MSAAPPRKNARPGPSIAEVASLAGVSKAGVSRVLNNGYASDEMQAKVRAAMKQLGYAPSAAAMNFASGRTGAIAVVANYIDSEWIPLVLRGLERAMNHDRRASLLLGSLNDGDIHDPRVVRSWLEERRVDGAIFLRPQKSERTLLKLARDQAIPHVAIAPDIPVDGVTLRSDNLQGGRALGTHLIELGHRRLCFVGGESTSKDSLERLEGLRQVLSEHSLQLPDREVLHGTFEVSHGRAAGRRWLRRKDSSRPTAIICADDTIAVGFMRELLQAKMTIPEEVSITGFNDMPASKWAWPALTTVSQPLLSLGESAATHVLSAVAAGESSVARQTVVMPIRLVVRQTTGPAPA